MTHPERSSSAARVRWKASRAFRVCSGTRLRNPLSFSSLCRVYIDPTGAVHFPFLLDTKGEWAATVKLTNDKKFAGKTLFAQAGLLTPKKALQLTNEAILNFNTKK